MPIWVYVPQIPNHFSIFESPIEEQIQSHIFICLLRLLRVLTACYHFYPKALFTCPPHAFCEVCFLVQGLLISSLLLISWFICWEYQSFTPYSSLYFQAKLSLRAIDELRSTSFPFLTAFSSILPVKFFIWTQCGHSQTAILLFYLSNLQLLFMSKWTSHSFLVFNYLSHV